MGIQKGKRLIRFLIPFHMDNYEELKGEGFKSLKNTGWESESFFKKKETDLYTYITDLTKPENENACAFCWQLDLNKNKVLKKKCEENKHAENRFRTNLDNKKSKDSKAINWMISKAGLIIFTTEIGILWYEIKTENELSMEEMQKFIYTNKELAHSNDYTYRYYDQICDPADADSEKEKLKNRKGIEITGEMKIRSGTQIRIDYRQNCQLYEDVLKGLLQGIRIDTFYIDREKGGRVIPDRQLGFSWICEKKTDPDKDEILENSFRLGRNYKSTYKRNKVNDSKDFFQPFEDSVWYVCLEGCSNYTYPNYENSFYENDYVGKLSQYFYLYLLCLGQYFSLLQLAHEASKITAEESRCTEEDSRLETMLDKIHIFNLKNKYSQVSYFTHQNEYYRYLQDRIGIDELQEELEVELSVLHQMLAQKREEEKQKRYRIFTCCSAVFVMIELFCTIQQTCCSLENVPWVIRWQLPITAGIMLAGVAAAVAACAAWNSIDKRWGKRNGK